MGVSDRLKLIVKWIIGAGYASTQKDVGVLLGYKNESSFSQLLNGKKTLPSSFIKKLNDIDNRIDGSWLLTGEGDMIKNQSNVKYIVPYINEALIDVPYVSSKAMASFIESMYSIEHDLEYYGVRPEDGEDLKSGNYIVFDVEGDSMYPTIHSNSKILCKKVEEGKWDYAKGVVVVIYGKTLTVKRVLKNQLFNQNTLTLKADNPIHGELEIEKSEIRAIWQAIRVISMKIV